MIRVGIIGTGLIAKEHARAISMLSGGAGIVAAADIDVRRLEAFCSAFLIRHRYQNANDLIADPDVDLVVITTPPAVHEVAAVSAMEAGKYVLCEKPLAHSMASASRIVEASARYPGRLSISHQLRYEPSFRRVLWLCRNNRIGDIQSASVQRHSYIPHAVHRRNSWWGSWDIGGGGVLITQVIHELDFLLLVMGAPLSVLATMDTRYTGIESEDYVDATIRFRGDATARCVASVNSGRLEGRFTVRGSSGTVGMPWNFTTNASGGVLAAIQDLDSALPDTRPASSSLASRGSRFLARQLGAKAKQVLTPHAHLYHEIMQSIQLGRPLPIPATEALGPLELCFAVYESAMIGKDVALPLTSASAVYGGVSKEQYDASRLSRKRAVRKAVQPLAIRKTGEAVRVGLIGLDTTHASAFTGILNDPNNPFHIPGARVVVAYPGGSPDMPISISRVGGFTTELRDNYGVQIVDAPEDVAERSDLVFIIASDGRTHPGLLSTVASHGKPIFVDKPFAVSASDATGMFTRASEAGITIFASSAFRYADDLVHVLQTIRAAGERVRTCSVHYWLQIQESQGRYFWYGIHASEMLLAVMGKGACEVEASTNGDQDTINVWHEDGRQSRLIGSQSDRVFRVGIETDKRRLEVDLGPSNSSLAARVLAAALDVLTEGKFPRLWGATTVGSVSGGRPGRGWDPDKQETLEVIGLLDAAQRSHATPGRTRIEWSAVPMVS